MTVECRYERRGEGIVCHLASEGGEVTFDVDLDPSSWRDLGRGYAKDSRLVLLFGEVVEGADAASFVVLGDTFAKDARSVFFRGSLAPEPPDASWDPATFVSFGDRYGANRGIVYCVHYGYDCHEAVEVVGADPSDFEEVGLTFGRAPRGGLLYDNGDPVPSIDAATFELRGPWFAVDRDAVYHLAYGGKHTDELSLRRIDAEPRTFAVVGPNYARDARTVFYYLNDSGDADLAEIWPVGEVSSSGAPRVELLPDLDGYARVGDRIVNHGEIESRIADPEGFKPLGKGFACDRRHVYRMRAELRTVAREAGEFLIETLAPEIVTGADPSTFVVPAD